MGLYAIFFPVYIILKNSNFLRILLAENKVSSISISNVCIEMHFPPLSLSVYLVPFPKIYGSNFKTVLLKTYHHHSRL